MAKSIALRDIAPKPIARRRIASKARVLTVEPYVFSAAAASRTFTPPQAGNWKFVGWGPGGSGNNGVSGGPSGAYFEITRYLTPFMPVTINVPQSLAATTVTFSDGKVVTAPAGGGGAPTGGDVNLAGSAGALDSTGGVGLPGLGTGGGLGGAYAGASSGGSGAPANLPYTGGVGGNNSNGSGIPGVGAGGWEASSQPGGPGQVIAVFMGS